VPLSLFGRNFDVARVELVTLTDAEPYIRGTRQFHEGLSDPVE
jgi:hypothetical protein